MNARNAEGGIWVVCFTGNSGLTDYSYSLCQAMSCLTTRVELWTAESYDTRKYQSNFKLVRFFRRTRHYAVDILRFLVRARALKPAVIIFQSWLKTPLLEIGVIQLLRSWGIRVHITVHDLLPHDPFPWSAVVLKRYYRQFDGLIVHSEKQRTGLLELAPFARVLTVPHGVYDIFRTNNISRETARRRLHLPDSASIALFFGHLEERKGILEFIGAEAHIAPEQDVLLMVAGAPGSSSKVAESLQKAKDSRRLRIADRSIPHEEVQEYFAACDVVVMPYLEGTTSGVMKLAMAFDRPVICSDVGDFRETLSDWPGLIVHPPTPVALARTLEDVASGRSLRASANAVADKYSWHQIAREYYAFVEQ